MRAKKSYGQHFLTDTDIAERIVNSLEHIPESRNVLEIGPGKGILTQYLLQRDLHLTAVEADQDMVMYLLNHFPEAKIRLIQNDFLKTHLEELFAAEQFSVIGNFPYNISSQIVFRVIDLHEYIPEMVGMFQREMAWRIVSDPGSKDYGIISVLTQAYYEGKWLFKVSPGSFHPSPKVQSGVIRLTRHDVPRIKTEYSFFRRVVKQAFSQRRKMLRNTLKSLFHDQKDTLKAPIFSRRPEKLTVEEFDEICQMLA